MSVYKRNTRKKKLSDGEHSYKSLSLERELADQIRAIDKCVNYEPYRIQYTIPAKIHKYTPDFLLKNGVLIEAKGRFVRADRQKHLLIKAEHPELDIRFIFQNPNIPLQKGAKSTYGEWATKHGFKWAKRYIPDEWFKS